MKHRKEQRIWMGTVAWQAGSINSPLLYSKHASSTQKGSQPQAPDSCHSRKVVWSGIKIHLSIHLSIHILQFNAVLYFLNFIFKGIFSMGLLRCFLKKVSPRLVFKSRANFLSFCFNKMQENTLQITISVLLIYSPFQCEDRQFPYITLFQSCDLDFYQKFNCMCIGFQARWRKKGILTDKIINCQLHFMKYNCFKWMIWFNTCWLSIQKLCLGHYVARRLQSLNYLFVS